MVLAKTNTSLSLQAEVASLTLESGILISYVAAKGANPRSETQSYYDHHEHEKLFTNRRRNSSATIDDRDDWEGVNALCQLIDTVIYAERETNFFENKNVLEIGFATGLPSVYALAHGANEVAVHCQSKEYLEYYIKPTLHRTNSDASKRVKLSSGDLIDCRIQRKFDVIIAPEILNCPIENFDEIHSILDRGLSNEGVCFISARTTYLNNSGSLPQFLSLIGKHRKFVPLVRWTSPRNELHPRQIIQITRNLNF